jgi:SpoVK/Ycf46/Vps4 family AAA+-type ATPase
VPRSPCNPVPSCPASDPEAFARQFTAPPPIKVPAKAEKQIEQPENRNSGDRHPQLQTALNAAGRLKKDRQSESPTLSLENDDKRMIEIITNVVLMNATNTKSEYVAGLEETKLSVQEAAICPELFTDLREAPRRVPFVGAAGTNKTVIAKALATEAQCTFFSNQSSVPNVHVG